MGVFAGYVNLARAQSDTTARGARPQSQKNKARRWGDVLSLSEPHALPKSASTLGERSNPSRISLKTVRRRGLQKRRETQSARLGALRDKAQAEGKLSVDMLQEMFPEHMQEHEQEVLVDAQRRHKQALLDRERGVDEEAATRHTLAKVMAGMSQKSDQLIRQVQKGCFPFYELDRGVVPAWELRSRAVVSGTEERATSREKAKCCGEWRRRPRIRAGWDSQPGGTRPRAAEHSTERVQRNVYDVEETYPT